MRTLSAAILVLTLLLALAGPARAHAAMPAPPPLALCAVQSFIVDAVPAEAQAVPCGKRGLRGVLCDDQRLLPGLLVAIPGAAGRAYPTPASDRAPPGPLRAAPYHPPRL